MTQRTLFPLLLVGLPVGLAISVGAALYLYYHPLDFPQSNRSRQADTASMLRRSPNEQDLRDYRRILTTDLALGRPADPARQRAVANWIASTLGPSNLGLNVQTVESAPSTGAAAAAVAPSPSLIVEVPGTRQKNDVFLLATGYHTEIAEVDAAVSTATVMSVAGAFAGTPQRRTLVFAFLGSEGADALGRSPLDTLVQSLKLRGLTVRGMLDLRVGAAPAADTGAETGRARAVALAPRDGQSWTGEVREAFATRKPSGLTFDFAGAADAPAAAATLSGWGAAPAPFLLLWLSPAAANDEASPLALARSLEGVLQALANQ